jgi:outer membrane protein assembly factor BamD
MRLRNLLFLLIPVIFAACSPYNRVLKGSDMDAKMEYAVKLYNKGDYFKALPLLEELITVYRGTQKAELTYYYYAYTNYRLGDYTSAAFDFENFARTFPTSQFAEECAFMHAYCYYQDSPDFSLDQTNTLKAINELQLFADRFPSSHRIEECNRLIDQLRGKLETKSFEQARLYFNMEDYKAAVTALRNLMNDFPSTTYRENALFLIVKSEFLLAENSIEDKKSERYSETLAFYGEFSAAFPESKYRKEADDIANTARRRLERINGTINPASSN